MQIWELIILSVALAVDAAAVSISNTMCFSNIRKKHYLLIPLSFAIFQGIMPLLGYYLLYYINFGKFSEIIIFIIFVFLGGKMIFDALFKHEDEKCELIKFTFSILMLQSVSTSIDAFAVGITFVATGINQFFASAVIAVITFIICFIAMHFGTKLRKVLGSKAMLFGGLILIILAIKALI
ncbi:MAG: hypothetical protein A2Y17_08630 [Clostridiales bacterium GWF2_38_85]|nr:MAG: hypothetical protein A2Y17_08630 [Clostridiales bacterium GWF2_38_85]HBL83740.1 hypothetical protein [Clostridiales bacterium]